MRRSAKVVLASIVESFWEKETNEAVTSLLDNFRDFAKSLDAFPVLVIDGANVVLGNELDDKCKHKRFWRTL